MSATTSPPKRTVAIYCRKSTEEGLDREFNSLDAQRQSCEHFAASQRHEGWVVSPERYDDGGFSGGNTERPGLQRLLAAIDAGTVQVVAVYKLDRMSRSLTDFVGLLQRLDAKQVAFVSVTQHFNTATPMGRLMLNILICFAQFERENTIERIRDKVAATKRQGRWCGGVPILGYDVAPGGRKLVVNEAEAERVRAIFELYREHRTLSATLKVLEDRGWSNKAWTNRSGRLRGGSPFRKSTLARTLNNILYTGRIRYRNVIYQAEHTAILGPGTFDAIQSQLASQARSGGAETRTKHIALLRGLLVCGPCGCGMTYCYSRRGTKIYGYYTCANSRERGANTCPLPSLPAIDLELLVVAEVFSVCRNAGMRPEGDLCGSGRREGSQTGAAEQGYNHLASIGSALSTEQAEDPSSGTSHASMSGLESSWAALAPKERLRLLRSLVDRVTIDGHAGKLAVTFRIARLEALIAQPGAA